MDAEQKRSLKRAIYEHQDGSFPVLTENLQIKWPISSLEENIWVMYLTPITELRTYLKKERMSEVCHEM